MLYEIGQPIMPPSPEGVRFDMTDGGGLISIIFHRPTTDEIAQFHMPTKLAFAVKDDVIFLLVKLGSLAWMDAPYNRQLSLHLTHIDSIDDGQAIAFHVLLVDGETGGLVAQKLVSGTTAGSRLLAAAIMSQPIIPDYHDRLKRIMAAYTTLDLVKMSTRV